MVTKTSKGHRGLGMEGNIASWYARITQKDIEEFRALARRVAEEISEGSSVLEVAPGPGYLAIELARLGPFKITGVDISRSFVEIARKKAQEAGVEIDFRQGDVAHLPFAEGTFDFIVCRAAFKNFTEPVRALNEMHRVLKAGGKAVIIDLRRDVSSESIDRYVKSMGLSRVNSLITKLTFELMLKRRAYIKDEIQDFASQTRFKKCEILEDPMGFEVRLLK